MQQPYTYTKLIQGTQVAIDMLEEKIQKLRKNGDAELKRQYEKEQADLQDTQYRYMFARQVCGDPTVIAN